MGNLSESGSGWGTVQASSAGHEVRRLQWTAAPATRVDRTVPICYGNSTKHTRRGVGGKEAAADS